VTGPSTSDRAPLPPGLAACPVIAILRRLPAPAVLPLARALLAGGVRVLELTVDSPDALSMISALRHQLPELTVGAGTVLDGETARRAVSAGAGFLVSPHTDRELLDFACDSGVALIPGAATASEAVAAWKGGATAVKLFPASVLGVPMLDALRDPLPHIRFIAVGGMRRSMYHGHWPPRWLNRAVAIILPSTARDIYSSLISITRSLFARGPWEPETGAKDGSQRVQTAPDSPRPGRSVCTGERLSVRLRPTVSDF
jgi:2-dehydro-3-deoxyphosphogluconate aldolase / (4S)-4-hydroxy-2-oxoglutarate aldolase